MALQRDEKTITSSFEHLDPKLTISKLSVKSKTPDTGAISKNSKSSIAKRNSRVHSKTADGITFNKQQRYSIGNSVSADSMKKSWSSERFNKTELCLNKMKEDKAFSESKVANEKQKSSNTLFQSSKDCVKTKKKLFAIRKSPDAFPEILKENNSCGTKKTDNAKESTDKRPTEIPKLKFTHDNNAKKNSKIISPKSKLPLKSILKEPKRKQCEAPEEEPKIMAEPSKVTEKPPDKLDPKNEEKLKEAMKKDFNELVPLYHMELEKVTDIWINAIYASLKMRTNLVKFLHQAFPCIDKTVFQMEDGKLHYCVSHAKNATKTETENLMLFIKSLILGHEKLKEQYLAMAQNEEIAQMYNYDWQELTRKMTELGEDIKRVKMEISELLKKKEEVQASGHEIVKKLEQNLIKKSDDIQNVNRQLYFLKQKEISCKGNVFLNVEDYKDIKEDVRSLKAVQKEYEELKTKYKSQNEMYEKKIKELETLLEEKTSTLERENGVKKQLQLLLDELQAQGKHLTKMIGKDQFEYFLGQLHQGKDKKMEQIWMIALKLVLKGFLMQIRKLERDRNKMLLELHTYNSENLSAFANSLIQKDNFIESVKQQMKCYFDKTSRCPSLDV